MVSQVHFGSPSIFSDSCAYMWLMGGEPDATAIFRLLEDEYVRAILAATSHESMSAKRLSKECDASLPTIYRRLEALRECDLLTESTHLDPDGNHYTLYETTVKYIGINIEDGTIDVHVAQQDDAAGRFTRLWERLGTED
jgi:DNA-binding transcriptional ArsR family regulator